MKKVLILLLCAALLCLTACVPQFHPPESYFQEEGAPETTPAPETKASEAPVTKVPETAAPETEAPGTEAPATEAPVTEAPTTEPLIEVDPDSLYTELYADDGSYSEDFDGYVQTTDYSFHLPQLTIGTPSANAINSAIVQHFEPMINESYESMESGLSIINIKVSWWYALYQNILTTVVECDNDWGQSDYGVYCYALDTDEYLSGSQVLSRLGIDQQDFIEATRAAAGDCFDSMYGDVPEEVKDDFYNRQRSWTVSDQNINLNLQFYPLSDGQLAVITPIGSIAGADWYYYEIYPTLG